MTIDQQIANYRQTKIKHLHDLKNFYFSLDFIQAVTNAAMAIDPSGKMNPHQRRIGKRLCTLGAAELSKTNNLQELKQKKTFEKILLITESVQQSIPGLGKLWSYDAALRIGFKKDIFPTEIYLHAGVIIGAKRVLGRSIIQQSKLPLGDFPEVMHTLEPYEAENFLCAYKKVDAFF